MKLNRETLEYLEGKKFSNSLLIPYDYKSSIPDRIHFLTDLVKNKKIIHLGCLDHLPLINEKIKKKQWLHKELTESSKDCLGIDINQEVKDYVKAKYGYDNIILGDFTKDKLPQISSQQWDYAVLGEILEHIDNPVEYLGAIRKNYLGSINKIIITVPNAWTQTTIRVAKNSGEIINSDHRYWFTPYTLSKIVILAGMEVEEIFFANRVPLSFSELVIRKLMNLFGRSPKYNFTYASSIVLIAKL